MTIGNRPALFLDRDGTLIVEKHYLHTPDGVELVPGAAEALKVAKNLGFLLVVVTNQAGIGRGYYTVKDYLSVEARVVELLRQEGVMIDGTYYCPHAPDAGCGCRKPMPELLERAVVDFNIDVAASVMIGDRETDILAGKAAGVGRTMLVKTGYGLYELTGTTADFVVGDICEGIELLLNYY